MPTEAWLPEALSFVTLDVFTDQRYAGNPLAVVEGADGLSDAAMQVMAREFNLSETIFVRAPADPGNSASVRIFFPTAEIPFAGHPTIGCAIHLALADAPEGDFEVTIRLEEVAGLVPVVVQRRAGRINAELTAPVVPHATSEGAAPSAELAAGALGLEPSDIGFGTHGPGVWQGGPRFVFLPVASTGALARARPCEPAWSRMMELAAVDSAYLYTRHPGCDYRARMFSPTAGIPEDPATGSASAILAAQLLSAGELPEGDSDLVLHQGVEMGRPSEVGLGITVTNGALVSVRIAGTATEVSRGTICPPGQGIQA